MTADRIPAVVLRIFSST